MKFARRRFGYLLALAALLAATAGVAQGAEGSFERTLTVTGPVDLEVTTGSGRIEIRAGEPGTVFLRGKIKARNSWLLGLGGGDKVRALEQNPPIEQEGNTIRIGRIEERALRRNVSISYEIVVPIDTELRASTGSGGQEISGVRGPVRAETGSGGIKLASIGSEARASTGSGGITLEQIDGSAEASTGSGSIRATQVAGSFEGSTGSGNVRIELSAPGDVHVSTGSGRVEISGVRGAVRASTGSGGIRVEGEPTDGWKLHTSSGGITVRLPGEAAFELYARTSSGSIYLDHPVTVRGKLTRKEVRGEVRGGGPLLDLRTSSGNIRVE